MDPRFIHLHLHTEYSLVDGLVGVKPLVKAARKAGMPAVAITDQCNFFALVRFYKAALGAGIKPIAGADLWVKNPADPNKPHRLVLLVQDKQGYGNLTRLISRAYVEGQHLGVPQVERDWIAAAPHGLIALSGGPQGDVASALLAGNRTGAEYLLDQWLTVFGDRYYLELIRTGREQEAELVEQCVDLALAKGVPVVATNDVRFLAREDFEAHEVRVCIHEGRTLDDPRRPRVFSEEQYLRTPAEMVELFADCPEALENSVEIAKRCNLELELGKNYLPDFPVPTGLTMDQFFRAESAAGLERRFERGLLRAAADQPERRRLYAERLDLELGVICQMGFPGYFLIVADFIAWAKRNGIPVGPGRGSGAGSLVAYALGITDLDPIQHDLLFERFLNPERVSMPDFDIDFCMEGRDRVIDYVADRYGREAVSQIITFGTMAAKAVVRDVGRVMGHPYGFCDRVAKMVPFELGMTLEKALEDNPDLKAAYEDDEEVHNLIDMGRKLEGCTRNAGKHAGGVVIAPTRLTDFAPLYCEPGGDNLVTQFDKDDVESVGLVKFDFLGLRTLTIIDWALKTINAHRPPDLEPIEIEQIDPADPDAFALLKRCETTAVFQLESRGMKELIKKLQPDSFGDITALVALFRPGPLQSGMVDDFINRKHGRADVAYPHPDLEPVLAPTYGIILYQEQVMQIAQVLSGYSLGGADLLRRAMGKKKAEEMAKQRVGFQEGAEQRGVDRGIAAHIFDLMEKFAGYGFNKCVVGETLVADPASGELREVKDIYRRGLAGVASLHADGTMGCSPVVQVMENGIRPVQRLTTSLGKSLRATDNHPLLTPDGWKPLGSLAPGDRIASPSRLPVEGRETWPEHELRIVGQKANEKHFPAAVFRLDHRSLAVLLGRLWSGDGYVAGQDGNNMTPYLATASRRLACETQHLLLRLGIVSRLTQKRFPYKDGRIGYTVHLLGRTATERFVEFIGPHLMGRDLQRGALQQYLEATPADHESVDTLPAQIDSEIFWERVVSIEPDGAAMTYDLEVADTHNFVANDIIVHNSHSAAYALVSYQTLWLKTHYPAAFMAAVLSADMDNTDKVVTLIEECRLMKLQVKPPAVNHSEYRFTIAGDDTVVYGLGAIKGVGEGAIEAMLEARRTGGPFRDLWEFCRRIDLHKANRRVLEGMIRAGALDGLAPNRATLMAQLPLALKFAEQHRATQAAGQFDLFGGLLDSGGPTAAAPDPQIASETREDWDDEQRLSGERETLGLYLTGHPIDRYTGEIDAMVGAANRIARLKETERDPAEAENRWDNKRRERDRRTIAGLVVSVRPGKTQRGRMCSVLLDDRTGRIEVTVFSELYETTRSLLVPDQMITVTGSLSFDDFRNDWTFRAEDVRTFEQARESQADHLALTLGASPGPVCDLDLVEQIKAILEPFRGGDSRILLDYQRAGVRARLLCGDAWRVQPRDALLKQLRRLLGNEAVSVCYQRGTLPAMPAEPERPRAARLTVVR